MTGPPHYSTSIADAWEVVEKMNARRYTWMATPYGTAIRWDFLDNGRSVGAAQDQSVPLANCWAALKTVGVEVPHDSIGRRSGDRSVSRSVCPRD